MTDYYRNKNLQFGSDKEMPLDQFAKEQNMFEGSNPYSAPQEPGVSSGSVMDNEELMKQVSTPNVDFKKPNLQGQMAPKSEAGEVLSTGSDALIAFGDPSMKALGLGLKAAQGISQAQRQKKMDRYNAEVAKIQARQDAINKMAQIGQGLKA